MHCCSLFFFLGLLDVAISFQQSPLFQHKQNLAGKTDGSIIFLSEGESIEEDVRSTKRRVFFNALGRSGIAFGASAFVSVEPGSAETGMLPDGGGGFKKPKGLGGLPNKIRNIGNIMVGIFDWHKANCLLISKLNPIKLNYLSNTYPTNNYL